MNFLINILYDLPKEYGDLIYFKQVTVKAADGTCLKYLDAMNYQPPQTLDSFAKTFGDEEFTEGDV
jgi:hypothetical protein